MTSIICRILKKAKMNKHKEATTKTQIQRTEQGLTEWKWEAGEEGKMGKGHELYSDGN